MVVWPANVQPTPANAEIVGVTAISTDTLTITRTQEGTSARSIVVGDHIAAAVTAKMITDIEANAAGVDIQSFTGNGTWTKPAGGVSVVKVICIGGSGGAYVETILPASMLGATEAVTVGAAGSGGGAGVSGGAGGDSSFGSWLTAYGGGGGKSGQSGTTAYGGWRRRVRRSGRQRLHRRRHSLAGLLSAMTRSPSQM